MSHLSTVSPSVNSSANSPRRPVPPRQQAYEVRLVPLAYRNAPIAWEVVRVLDGLVVRRFLGVRRYEDAIELADELSLARWDSYVSAADLAATIPARDDDRVSEADRNWLAGLNTTWHDDGPMACGYHDFDCSLDFEDAFDHDEFEHESVEAYLRRREDEGAAEEFARWGGHPG